jgi:hypothetical protein
MPWMHVVIHNGLFSIIVKKCMKVVVYNQESYHEDFTGKYGCYF